MSDFILGGYEEHVRYLRESHEARMQTLREQLAKATGPDEVLRLQCVVQHERDYYERRVSRAGDCEY